MDTKSDVIYQLRNSLEMRTIKRDVLLYTCIIGLPGLLIACTGSSQDMGYGIILLLFLLLPTLVFYIGRIISIFRKPENYVFCQCALNQPHSNPFLQQMYFTVQIEMPEGRTQTVDTHAIFAAHGILGPIMEDYINKTATIAYNPESEMVVVIG